MTCSRRLARLHALGLLSVHVPRLDGENLHTLTARGEALLAEASFDPELLHRGRGAARRDLGHLLAINDVRVAFAVACRARPSASLEMFLADPDLRRRAGLPAPPYVPDALIRVRLPAGEVGLVLEFDAGTERAAYFAATKGRALAALAREGQLRGLAEAEPAAIDALLGRLEAQVKHEQQQLLVACSETRGGSSASAGATRSTTPGPR